MSTTFSRLELQKIAKYHKLLLWSILAAIAANLSRFYLGDHPIGLLVYFGAAAFQIFTLYKLGKSLQLSIVWIILFILGLFVPLLGLLILLLMHDKAMKAMKAAGVKVGFMGADSSSI
jgi:sugar phosphate permease